MAADEHKITPDRFDAVLFDLDGVLTRTASVHAQAWKETFDAELERRAGADGTEFVPFDAGDDYDRYVDGKPRYDGVRNFLASRGITLPDGDPSDPPTADTVCGIGNRKEARFQELLARTGVETYDDAVTLLHGVRAEGVRTAVVSSSKNCQRVTEAAGIADLFDVRVDGNAVESGHLKGKPAPDTYLEAARQLGTTAARAVVVEDALAGVESGRAGDFGLVVGVDRVGQAAALREHGADVVVTDLATLLP